MNTPTVSVIVPVYNAEKYLRECLDSILAQTLTDIEVICIDAGSSDRSLDILHEYATQDKRITVRSGLGRLDAGAARNIGLSIATGEYLSFLDADDLFKPKMLEDCYTKAKKESSDIVVYYSQQLDMRTNKISEMPWSLCIKMCPKHSPFSPNDMSKYIFNAFQNWTWNKLFRKEFIIEKNIIFQSISRTNDMAFTCEALALAKRISLLPNVYTTYRVGTGTSLQQTNDCSPTCFWDAYKETRNRLITDGVYEMFKQSFINTVLSGSLYNLQSVKSDLSYCKILHLLKYESSEFDFDNHKITYFYNIRDYIMFRLIRIRPIDSWQRTKIN